MHAELSTKTKIFCHVQQKFGAAPNTQTCPICMAMPGTLPVLNEKVVEYAVKAGLATNVRYLEIVKMIEKIIFIQIYQKHIKFAI